MALPSTVWLVGVWVVSLQLLPNPMRPSATPPSAAVWAVPGWRRKCRAARRPSSSDRQGRCATALQLLATTRWHRGARWAGLPHQRRRRAVAAAPPPGSRKLRAVLPAASTHQRRLCCQQRSQPLHLALNPARHLAQQWPDQQSSAESCVYRMAQQSALMPSEASQWSQEGRHECCGGCGQWHCRWSSQDNRITMQQPLPGCCSAGGLLRSGPPGSHAQTVARPVASRWMRRSWLQTTRCHIRSPP
mmetsp:Transcript_14631/g.41920  ORF Transcript_14631/g.41920 Transcript_14631/m.41920 type:complete len:246 (+) Transcript_14631:1139-1876(+)